MLELSKPPESKVTLRISILNSGTRTGRLRASAAVEAARCRFERKSTTSSRYAPKRTPLCSRKQPDGTKVASSSTISRQTYNRFARDGSAGLVSTSSIVHARPLVIVVTEEYHSVTPLGANASFVFRKLNYPSTPRRLNQRASQEFAGYNLYQDAPHDLIPFYIRPIDLTHLKDFTGRPEQSARQRSTSIGRMAEGVGQVVSAVHCRG
jgi:hypothetical protein